jgi:type II secretion system protein N
MMNPFRNRVVLCGSLILYTLLLATGLLYFRFPAEKLKLSCQFKLEQLLSVNHSTIGQLRYHFPFGMVANKIQFSSRTGEGGQLVTIDQAILTPALTSPRSRFLVTLNAGGGKHDFTLILNRTEDEFTLKDVHLRDLDLSQVPFLSQATTREITGSLGGNGTYHRVFRNGKYETDGQGTITLTKGSFALLYPILSLKEIDLQRLQTDISLQGGNLKFSNGIFNGEELKGDFFGILGLKSGLGTSTLSFQGKLDPLPPLFNKSKHTKNMINQMKKQHNQTGLPFRLNGIVQKPSFRFAP